MNKKESTYPIPEIIKGDLFVDDRGSLRFCNNWMMGIAGIKRFYQVQNHQAGFIRAFHGHARESKFVYVVKGAALVVTFPLVPTIMEISKPPFDLRKFVLSAETPAVLHIPAGFYNGFKTLTEDAIILFFSTSTVEESKTDDVRQPWNCFNTEAVWKEDYR